jgi:hypothetical protein
MQSATATATATKPQPNRAPPRMTISSVLKGKRQTPIRVLLYGTEGIGKSTFGAEAPKPIFLGAEDGTAQLDVERFPSPESWQDVLDAIRVLEVDAHDYRTLVVDTIDWAEPLLWEHICRRDKQENIEAYGYGKGYAAALDEWRVMLGALERLRKAKALNVVLIAHSWIRPFKNPEGEDFDRYELKLHPKAGGLVKEWADAVLFANYETFVAKDGKTKRSRGVDTGARLLFTERRAAYDAKNRYGLPTSLPLSWSDFEAAVQAHQPATPEALLKEVERKAEELGGEDGKAILAALGRAAGDPQKLAYLNNRANAKLAQKEET